MINETNQTVRFAGDIEKVVREFDFDLPIIMPYESRHNINMVSFNTWLSYWMKYDIAWHKTDKKLVIYRLYDGLGDLSKDYVTS